MLVSLFYAIRWKFARRVPLRVGWEMARARARLRRRRRFRLDPVLMVVVAGLVYATVVVVTLFSVMVMFAAVMYAGRN